MSDMEGAYDRLAELWSGANWGWLGNATSNGALQQVLRDNFSEDEARALGDIPVSPIPLTWITLDEILANSSFDRERLEQLLDGIVGRDLLFRKKTADGQKAYSLLSASYGFPQVFLWRGQKDSRAQRIVDTMADPNFRKAFMGMHTVSDAKVFRYVPVTEAIDPEWQNVYPTETIEKVIAKARRIALASCPCRLRLEIATGKDCGHPRDVCMKLNDLADRVIDADLAREISHEEALEVIKKADRAGLVHFADNTGEGIQHVCNCCGDACWNVGPIRRRQIPRDTLMATYFLRETNEDDCIACGNCVDICPVAAVQIVDDVAKVDSDWCIGCGVCVPRCSTQAIKLIEKPNQPVQTSDFGDLFARINSDRAKRVAARRGE